MSLSLVSYVLTAALRDRLVLALIVLMLVAVSLSAFMGSAAVVEQHRFAVVFAGASLRLTGVLGLVLFVVFMMRRSFESKDVELLLTRPVGRAEFLLSYAAAFSVLALVMGVAQGACVYILAGNFIQDQWLWVASIIMENIIMVNVALFFSMMLSSPAAGAMMTFAFYILARMMGQILGVLDEGSRLFDITILKAVMQGISVVTPRLDLMGQTSWLIYGTGDDLNLAFIAVQGIVFTFLILVASLIDLVRRQF